MGQEFPEPSIFVFFYQIKKKGKGRTSLKRKRKTRTPPGGTLRKRWKNLGKTVFEQKKVTERVIRRN